MNELIIIAVIFLCFTVFLCMIRAIKGPHVTDRIIAINVIGTKIIVIISLVSYLLNESYFIDVALTYALISFIATIIASKTIDTGGDNQ